MKMSCTNKSHSNQSKYCEVCKISIPTEAEYALHEFSKKHCDNLLRIAKNKPVVSKQKSTKSELPPVNKELPKGNVITTQGNFAKYGYFVHGEVYDTRTESKEFNTEYDPYLQKYAEIPVKDIIQPVSTQAIDQTSMQTTNVANFKKKKKKKIRICQICNVTLVTVPEYEAHMKSPQHSWRLKVSGMGVSAHFVKASTDLHTVDLNKDSKVDEGSDSTKSKIGTSESSTSSSVFPTLFCDICELLLNSEQQFNAHVSGKSHNDNVQRKADIKAKKTQSESVGPNQLYCFSCNVSLNNLNQYNEHKFGKKHKMKCKRLMREGYTIPPEERVESWLEPKRNSNKPIVYPELYEKFLQNTQKGSIKNELDSKSENEMETRVNERLYYESCCPNLSDQSSYQSHIHSEQHRLPDIANKHNDKCNLNDEKNLETESPSTSQRERVNESVEEVQTNAVSEVKTEKHPKEAEKPKILGFGDVLKCNICCMDFLKQYEFESHLTTETHAMKILELKGRGTADEEILKILFRDKGVVKPDERGRYFCSICSISTGSVVEFHQHMSSVLHRQTEEDYQKKKKIEVQFGVNPDETGSYFCKLCQDIYATLTEYNHHLHASKHKKTKAEKVRKIIAKNRILLQKKRVKQKYRISGLKRKDFACWRKKCEKNPGIRTKIAGMATNLSTGVKESIPNLEPLEPKIDSTKNVTIGVTEKSPKRPLQEDRPKPSKRVRPYTWKRGVSEQYHSSVKPLMAVNNAMPFLPRPHLDRHRPPNFMASTSWSPYYSPPAFGDYFGGMPSPRPRFPLGRYQRVPNFRPPRPRYPPYYN